MTELEQGGNMSLIEIAGCCAVVVVTFLIIGTINADAVSESGNLELFIILAVAAALIIAAGAIWALS
jgi:hypothetical protein